MNAFEMLKPRGQEEVKNEKQYVKYGRDKIVFEEQECPMCHTMFVPTYWQWRNQNASESAGPFCGKSCASKYNSDLRHGGPTLPTIKIKIKKKIPVLREFIVPNSKR